MTTTELNELIITKLGVIPGTLYADFAVNALRFHYHGNTYRVTTDLNVEKVDGARLVTDSDARQLEKLLRGEQWDGTGLPPVGTICQMRDVSDKWVNVEIIANHKGFAHGWQDSTEDTYYSNKHCEFRPLRTERDKAIEQIRKVGSSLPASVPFAIEEAAAIYDAIVAGKIDGLGKVG